jgi:hypothetical protein
MIDRKLKFLAKVGRIPIRVLEKQEKVSPTLSINLILN